MTTIFYREWREDFDVINSFDRKVVIAEGEEFDDWYPRKDGFIELRGEGGTIFVPWSQVLMIDKRDDEYS